MSNNETIPNYDYKQVLIYLQLFKIAAEVSNGLLNHTTPTKQRIKSKTKLLYPEPTTLQLINKSNTTINKTTPILELQIIIMEHIVELKETNNFMYELSLYIKQLPLIYQNMFGEHIEAYTKNRLLITLPTEEHWRAHKAAVMYTKLEDYIKAFIAVHIVMNEEKEDITTKQHNNRIIVL